MLGISNNLLFRWTMLRLQIPYPWLTHLCGQSSSFYSLFVQWQFIFCRNRLFRLFSQTAWSEYGARSERASRSRRSCSSDNNRISRTGNQFKFMVIWSTEQVDLSSQSYFISDSSNKTRSPDTDIHYGLKRITTWNMTVTRSWERNQISLVNFVVSCSLWSFLKVPRVAAIWTSRVTPGRKWNLVLSSTCYSSSWRGAWRNSSSSK